MTVALTVSPRTRTPAQPRLDEVHRLARRLAHTQWSSLDWAHVAFSAAIRYWEIFGGRGGPASPKLWFSRHMARVVAENPHLSEPDGGWTGSTMLTPTDTDVDLILDQVARPELGRLSDSTLQRALGSFKGREVQVLRMRLSGHSPTAVALKLHTSPRAVDWTYAEVKRRLKMLLMRDRRMLLELREGDRDLRFADI